MAKYLQPHFSDDIFYVLLPISLVAALTGMVGNTYLLQNSFKRYRAKKSIPGGLFFCLCFCNIISCYLGLPLHIVKLVLDYRKNIEASSYLCMFRYVTVLSTTNFSLLMLTMLVLSRKEKIFQVSSGEGKKIKKLYLKCIIITLILLSTVPNVVIFFLYLQIYNKERSYPCQKPTKKMSIQKTLEIIAIIYMIIIVAPSIILLLRSIANIKNKIKLLPNRSRKIEICIKKLNISYMYAGIFFVFWIPFGIMSLCSGNISKEFYNAWFNIGYTISFGYVVLLPLIFVLTDKNVEKDIEQKFTHLRRKRNKRVYELGAEDGTSQASATQTSVILGSENEDPRPLSSPVYL